MDRSEDSEFSKKHYRDGRRAFNKGRTQMSNPWPLGTLAFRSWGAGWSDRNAENWADAEADEKG